MSDNMFLMCKGKKVMEINLSEGLYRVMSQDLLPYQLKGRIVKVPVPKDVSKRELTRMAVAMNKNYDAVVSYLASRVLPLTRKNAKKIYDLFGFEQLDTNNNKARISIACRGVSLQDEYWFNPDGASWKDVDLRTNSLSEIVAQVALRGDSLTLQGEKPCTPEINGQGIYAKAWKREGGKLWLHKAGDEESKIEICVSKILDKTNVPHVRYFPSNAYGIFTCKCECMTDEKKSILPGMDFVSYCNATGLDPLDEIMKKDKDSICKMMIVDYVISNRDRHGLNWGFFYNADDMHITGCHPLFDHNNAFDEGLMANKDAPYQFDGSHTMREWAKYAIKRTNFEIREPITKSDFMTKNQYDSFRERCDDLGLAFEKEHVSLTRTEHPVEVIREISNQGKESEDDHELLPT